MQMWKFVLEHGDNEVLIPEGGMILSVDLSERGPALFVAVEPERESETRTFTVVGNGEDLPEVVGPEHYRGMAHHPGVPAAHVFETTSVQAAA
jgi:hypothetical protein